MKRIFIAILLTGAGAAFMASCAENVEPDLTEFHNAAFDRWMEKYHPGIDRLESGLYIEWIERNPDGKKLIEGYFMSLDYTAKDQNGDYFLTRNETIARQVGFQRHTTHYVPEYSAYTPSSATTGSSGDVYYDPYGYGGYGYGGYGYGDPYGYGGYGGYGDPYGYGGYGYGGYYPGLTEPTSSSSTTTGYPVGVWQALGMMNEGDSVRLYIPPAMGYTSGFTNFRFVDLTDSMGGFLDHWEELGLRFEAVYKEYISDHKR